MIEKKWLEKHYITTSEFNILSIFKYFTIMEPLVSREVFLEKQKLLPLKLQDAFFNDYYNQAIADAIILSKLNNEKAKSTLIDIVMAVILLIIPKEKFKIELSKRLEIPAASIEIINQIIQQRIFNPLSAELEQYKNLLPQQSFEIPKPVETPKTQQSRAPQIETLIKPERSSESAKQEESLKTPPIPDLTLPEVPSIKIERPVNKSGELKRVSAPSVSPEEQTKIHSKLLEAIKKKESTPKIVEQIKKIIESGPKVSSKEKPPPKTPVKAEEPTASKVIGGENSKKFDAAEEKTDATKKPYIFDVKLKEGEKEKSTKSEEPIVYKKYQPQKPFGEA